jgi:hypothetical protein
MKRSAALVDEARQANPTPDDAFEGLGRTPEAQNTLTAILSTPQGDPSSQVPATAEPRTARRRRRRAVAGALVATALLGGTALATIRMSSPDPEQSAQVVDDFSSVAEVHLDGWRPELAAESVVCLYPETEGALFTGANEFPLDEPLTPAKLARECTSNDWAQKLTQDGVGPFAVSTATMCVADEGTYPMAVVGVGGIDCTSTPIREPVPDVDEPVYRDIDSRRMTTEDLEQLNHMRAVEVAVLAVPAEDGCPSSEQATEWAQARLDEYGIEDLEVRQLGQGEGCYRGRVSWDTDFYSDTGEIRIDVIGNQP